MREGVGLEVFPNGNRYSGAFASDVSEGDGGPISQSANQRTHAHARTGDLTATLSLCIAPLTHKHARF